MTTDTDVTTVTTKVQNAGPGLCFLLLLAAWVYVFFVPESIFLVILGLISFAVIYFIYYLASEGHLADIIGGVVLSIILIGIAAAIPVIGWICLVVWIIYNIAKALESIRTLMPEALLSLVLYASLIIPVVSQLSNYGGSNVALTICCGIVYFFAVVACCARINDRSDTSKNSLFLFSVMLLSVPMIILLIASMVASLRSAFRMSLAKTNIKMPQNVSGYTTRSGTTVASYERMITKTVTNAVITPGMGAIGASLTGSLGETTTLPKKHEPQRLIAPKDIYATRKDHHFYRYDDLNDKKISNFIQAVMAVKTLPLLCKEDVLFYFDETLMGKGDRGVVVTDETIYCLPGTFEDGKQFCIRFVDIENVAFKGTLNKEIVLHLNDGALRKAVLTQSNAGAKKVYEVIQLAVSKS